MNAPDVERLAELLRTLREAGVSSAKFHADGQLAEAVFDGPVLMAAPAGEEQGEDASQELPVGVLDPRAAIAKIHAKHRGRDA